MPIFEDSNGHKVAEFGTGDIVISAAINPETKRHEAVFLEQVEGNWPIGTQHTEKNGRADNEIPSGSIRLQFKKSASVGILINNLSKIYKDLQEGESISA